MITEKSCSVVTNKRVIAADTGVMLSRFTGFIYPLLSTRNLRQLISNFSFLQYRVGLLASLGIVEAKSAQSATGSIAGRQATLKGGNSDETLSLS
jgi:hypothetical protein